MPVKWVDFSCERRGPEKVEATRRAEEQYRDSIIERIRPIKGPIVSFERQRSDMYLDETKNLEYYCDCRFDDNPSELFESISF